jgi:hypothetical protein
MEDMLTTANGQLQILERRTESFSPSKQTSKSSLRACPTAASRPLPPSPPPMSCTSTHNLTPCHCGHVCQSKDPFTATPALVPAPSPLGLSFPHTFPIMSISSGGKNHHVLLLSGLSGTHNPLTDLVLPSANTFCDAATVDASYPAFGAANCSWLAIFNLVRQPRHLWDSYAPRNIGDYPDVSTLWLSWSEGDFLEGVGRLPSLQQINQRWGSQKNKNKEGRLQAWRPASNTTVC